MIKQLKSAIILLSLMTSSFAFLSMPMLSAARVTYVQGDITQNTVWTLVDSPFIMSQNVTVYASATLTIEPGVQVRFGKDFFLIITGNLQANGNPIPIIFTSNREQPAEGDWGSILFNGVTSSSLTGCSITYAKDGILAQGGAAMIRSNTISYCSENGINSTNSALTIEDNLIANCPQGIQVTGSGNILIYNNTLRADGDGIVLTGSIVSNVNASQNEISENTNAGVSIKADAHSNLSIINNTVSMNNYGFYISSPTNTLITNNNVSDNNVGFYYDSGTHEAHYNDICNNTMGMEALDTATVNASRNYWGSQNGPYNEWLNPSGRGNPVLGNGNNIDFKFFLTKPTYEVNQPPVASLYVDKKVIWPNQPDQTITFVASNSFDEGRIDWYYFDFGDGQNSGWTTLSTFTHTYAPPGGLNETYLARVIVMDDFGASATDTQTVYSDWTLNGALEVSTATNTTTSMVNEKESILLTVLVTHLDAPVGNASVNLYAVRGGSFSESQGFTDANGYFTSIFTAPDVGELTDVKIIATASMNDSIRYGDGSSSRYVTIEPFLTVNVQPDQQTVKSEGSTQLTVLVTSNDQPVANANVTLSNDVGGLSVHNGITDQNGIVSTIFYAPQATIAEDSVVTATAEITNYGNGVGQATIRIDPKLLEVTITVEPNSMLSEAAANVSVHVEYSAQPINGANILMNSSDGSFPVSVGTTDSSGNASFNWISPAVGEESNVTVTAQATCLGYAEGTQIATVVVNPRTFNIEVHVNPSTLESGKNAAVNVNVTCREDGSIVQNATVAVAASHGTFLLNNEPFITVNRDTDAEGLVTFVFTGPQTANALDVDLTVNVTRAGYLSAESHVSLTVTPPLASTEGGWPIMMMLLILIPVIVLVIVAILIKTKVIVISSKEEE